MSIAATAPTARAGLPYKWLVVIAVVFGVFMSVLDSTITNIAIPKLQAVFGVSLDAAQWVITGYTLALTVSIPFFGWLADRIGTKNTYLISLAIFTLASALCGLAWNNTSLIVFRVIQGLGGGALLPLATAQIFAVFPPEERGKSSAAIGIPVLFAPALGPTVGGYLIEKFDWRLIFYINVPIGIVGLAIAWLILRQGNKQPGARLDVPGLICSTAAFASLIYGITLSESDGWGALSTRGFLLAGTLFLIALVLVELRADAPLLDMRLLKDWSFAGSLLLTVTLQIGLFGSLFLLPIFLQGLRGQTAYQAGLVTLPSALVTVAVLPIAGMLVDRIGAKWVVVMGAAALTFASFLFSQISVATPLWLIQLWLLGRSVAIAFTIQPAQVLAFVNIKPRQLARASAFFNVVRQVAVAFGTSILATYLGQQRPVHFAHLAERVTALSPAGQFISNSIAQAAVRGADTIAARAQAAALVVAQLQRQAAVLAFRDTFLLVAAISLAGLGVALTLRQVRRNPNAPAVVME